MPEFTDLLARFILAGALLIFGSDWLTPHSELAKAFFVSRAWLVLRYAVATATVVLCGAVLHDWS